MTDMFRGLIAGSIETVIVVFLVVTFLLLFQGIRESGALNSPEANAALEAGEQGTINLFNGWMIAGGISSGITLAAGAFVLFKKIFNGE